LLRSIQEVGDVKFREEDPGDWVDGRQRPRKLRLTGLLAVRRDGAGELLSAAIADADGATHRVLLDTKGTELARQMDGRRVVVNGHTTCEDGETFLAVRKFREARGRNALEADEASSF
jgi:hypothetical protein